MWRSDYHGLGCDKNIMRMIESYLDRGNEESTVLVKGLYDAMRPIIISRNDTVSRPKYRCLQSQMCRASLSKTLGSYSDEQVKRPLSSNSEAPPPNCHDLQEHRPYCGSGRAFFPETAISHRQFLVYGLNSWASSQNVTQNHFFWLPRHKIIPLAISTMLNSCHGSVIRKHKIVCTKLATDLSWVVTRPKQRYPNWLDEVFPVATV